MPEITAEQAAALIRRSGGRFFGCSFVKADGKPREMWCRYAELQKVGQHRERETAITVWDDHKKAYRSIPIARLSELRLDGEILEVTNAQ